MLERKKLEESAEKSGADLLGVAPAERFDGMPPKRDPRAIFPETKSIVMIGRRIPRGALRGVEEGTQFQGFRLFGSAWLEDRFLPMAVFNISEFIEDSGWEAVPLKNLPPEIPPMGVPVKKGLPAPNVMLDMDDAAVRAGLGEIGYCGLFLTPGFGPRQRFQAILTDAEIEPDELFSGKICPGKECGGFCPLGAVSGEKEINFGGKKMSAANIDRRLCEKCMNGAAPNAHHPAGKPDRLAAVCARSCVDYLEKRNVLSNRFANRFRKREPWLRKIEDENFYRL